MNSEYWFKTEEQLRRYIELRLQSRGVPYEREIACKNTPLRADLVLEGTVMECKRILTAKEIQNAIGQGVTYCELLKRRKLIVIGQSPLGEKQLTAALNMQQASNSKRIEVIFIDRDPRWGLSTMDKTPTTLAAVRNQTSEVVHKNKTRKRLPAFSIPAWFVQIASSASLTFVVLWGLNWWMNR